VESFRIPSFAFIHRYNMSTRNLVKIFNPKSIALIVASDTSGKLGYTLFRDLNQGGFKSLIHQAAKV
jgi:predicted CoA-binding protein